MLLVSLLFACMGVCVKLASTTHSAMEIVFYRSFLSLIMVFGLMRLKGVAVATRQLRWQLTRGPVGFTSLPSPP
jgi:drug/metabolite transporter (DMT)-like permease